MECRVESRVLGLDFMVRKGVTFWRRRPWSASRRSRRRGLFGGRPHLGCIRVRPRTQFRPVWLWCLGHRPHRSRRRPGLGPRRLRCCGVFVEAGGAGAGFLTGGLGVIVVGIGTPFRLGFGQGGALVVVVYGRVGVAFASGALKDVGICYRIEVKGVAGQADAGRWERDVGLFVTE